MAIGDNVLTVSEAVEKYMALSGKVNPANRGQYLLRGVEIWKDIRDNIFKTTTHKWVRVDKSKSPYRIELPKCASMFLSVGAINKCNEYVAFGQHNNMHVVEHEDVSKCSCDDEIKACIETDSTETENLLIEGTPYTKTIQTKVCSNGDIVETTITPVANYRCAPAYMYYVGFVDYFDDTTGIYKKTSSLSCSEKNSSSNSKIIINSFVVNGTEYVPSPVENEKGNSIEDTLALYNGLNIPGVTFRFVSADNYANYDEPYVSTTRYANVGWIVMVAPVSKTYTISGKFYDDISTSANTVVTISNQLATEPEFFDTSDCGFAWDSKCHFGVVFDGVEMVTSTKLICKLDTKPCGCLEVSQANFGTIESCMCEKVVEKCRQICSCQNDFQQPSEDSLTQNDAGYYKYNERDRVVYLYGDVPSQVLVNFKSNGEEDEYMPEYAFFTFVSGMEHINAMFSKTMNRFEKEQASQAYWAEKRKLEENLPRNKMLASQWDNNPIGIFVKW